jgi:ABC-type uncharacterized transport system permease subunit
MSKKSKKSVNINRQRNSYIIGISMGILFGLIFGYATENLIISTLACGLLGFGLGHAIYKTIG